MRKPSRWAWASVLFVLGVTLTQEVFGQNGGEAKKDSTEKRSQWRFIHANEFETPFMTFRMSAGLLMDNAWYAQDAASREQLAIAQDPSPHEPVENVLPAFARALAAQSVAGQRQETAQGELEDAFKFRDSRFMFNGRIKTKRPINWSAGLMWDGVAREWLVRQTGLVVAVPEIWGHLWIGRSKEGTSLNKVMVGYDGWTMERFPFSDASIPLLADGIKWMGYLPKQHLIWNLGVFADPLSKGQTFSYYEHQAAARIAYLNIASDTGRLVHAGINLRIGRPTDDTLHLKSKPESTTAPTFVNTGKFPARLSGAVGIEAYYRPGSWLFGGEYYLQLVDSDETGNPRFHGGDIVATWLVTGETRAYTTTGGYFRAVAPRDPVFKGGLGALELVLRLSYVDLDSGTLEGGTFWRIGPTVNWHLNRHIRFEVSYGYGVLDRFGLKGATQFFQTRLQTQL